MKRKKKKGKKKSKEENKNISQQKRKYQRKRSSFDDDEDNYDDEDMLSRALVSRCELDMGSMRDMYQTKYKITMKEDIIDDTSGSYQKLLVYLCEK